MKPASPETILFAGTSDHCEAADPPTSKLEDQDHHQICYLRMTKCAAAEFAIPCKRRLVANTSLANPGIETPTFANPAHTRVGKRKRKRK
jgi:hypothetical protein